MRCDQLAEAEINNLRRNFSRGVRGPPVLVG